MVSHKENRKQQLLIKSVQQQTAVDVTTNKKSQFNMNLCEAFILANIPSAKLNNESLRCFLEKSTTERISDESTIRKNYVGACYAKTLERIRSDLVEERIWVSIDETMDAAGRYVANVVIGKLVTDTPSRPFLLTTEVLEHTNHHTIAKLFNDALMLLWPAGIKHDNGLLLVCDAAAYMTKAVNGLKVLLPKMIHITCLAHGLHRVTETIRAFYPVVDRLISNVKKSLE